MARARGKDSVQGSAYPPRRQRAVYVFTEGTLTEPSYIDGLEVLKKEQERENPPPQGSISIQVSIQWDERTHGGKRGPSRSSHHRTPMDLVEAAVKLKREKDKEARRWEQKYKPAVWCLFDRDQHSDVQRAARLAEANDVKVAYSHPCFELWRLLHYQDYTSGFAGVCDDASGRLKAQPAFAKTYGTNVTRVSNEQAKLVLPDQLRGGYKKAKQRAVKMNDQHTTPEREKWDPYTDAWRFVEDGVGLTDY